MTGKPNLHICVYCGSRAGDNPDYAILAATLGKAMATNNLGLVYGGGSIGLMGILADEILAHNGHVIGIIPKFLDDREVGAKYVTDFVLVDTMHERKARMINDADILVALPGGIGTYDELFEAMTWANLDQHNKPIYLLGPESYWNPFLNLLKHVHDEGFSWSDPREIFELLPNVEALMAKVQELGRN